MPSILITFARALDAYVEPFPPYKLSSLYLHEHRCSKLYPVSVCFEL